MSWKLGMGALGILLLAAAGCSGGASTTGDSPPPGNTPPADVPMAPGAPVDRAVVGEASQCDVSGLDQPRIYGHKVKTVLTGLPLTTEELAALEVSRDVLPNLIDGWMNTAEFKSILVDFFRTAFQQDELDREGLTNILAMGGLDWGRFEDPRVSLRELVDLNIQESFARTALRIVESDSPFTEVATTNQYEMTTALLALHALVEHRSVSDNGRLALRSDFGRSFVFHRNLDAAPPLEEALDPTSPNFLHVYLPNFAGLCVPDDQDVYIPDDARDFRGIDKLWYAFSLIMGRPARVFNMAENDNRDGNPCQAGNVFMPPVLTRADFNDWRTVSFRPITSPDQSATPFWNLGDLRNADLIDVWSERVGFFTTLGFFSTWPTNRDNASRVTLNQTLITALGTSFEGNTVSDFSPPNLSAEHSEPGTSCYGCHQTLDPMRDFFRASYSFRYGLQDDMERMAEFRPFFVFRGTSGRGDGVTDLSRILAVHPEFASAWVQKMCFHANSKGCPEESEEFKAIVTRFVDGGLNFKAMVKDLFSSALVTNHDCVDAGTGDIRSISRRDQMCAQLSNRLGVENICGDHIANGNRTPTQRSLAGAITSIPKDTFARGEPDPVIISDTGLFIRATREVTCTIVAEEAYDAAFADASREVVLQTLVTRVIGLPIGDPRHGEVLAILGNHIDEGMAAGASERIALQSAMVVACMSPGMAGVGF